MTERVNTNQKKRKLDENTIILERPKRPVAVYDFYNFSPKHENKWDSLCEVKTNKRIKVSTDNYISGTQVKNYIMKDPMLDWLEMYYEKYGLNKKPRKKAKKSKRNICTKPNINDFGLDMFFSMGNEFEDKINTYLNRIFSSEIITINNEGRNGITEENFKKTKDAIFAGIPIILQGVLFNHENHTRGVTDILIRSDYINKLVRRPVICEKRETLKASKLCGNYHYLVVDIKWSTMTLCANGYNIRNDGRYPAYKGQLAIYTSILGKIQGYTPSEAYIMAKAWKIDSKKHCDYGFGCFDILGIVDYDGFDLQYIQKTTNAIIWLNDLKRNGYKWSPLNPKRNEMYPNASNKNDAPWTKIKKQLCEEVNEITQIWNVSDYNRNNAHKQGIFSWKDENCNSLTLGITGDTKPNTIDEILEINRNPKGTISPDLIVNNLCNWQESSNVDFYVDFETLNGCFLDSTIDINNSKVDHDIIFMIGVGYIQNFEWKFIKFVANSATNSEENRIITEFTNFITEKTKELDPTGEFAPRLFHWSHAEVANMTHAGFRHNAKWDDWNKTIVWVDMYDVFIHEPIVVHGALNFKLKSIGKAMHKLGFVKTVWEDSGPSDGLDAMISAIKLYRDEIINSKYDIRTNCVMQDIIKYNEVDCKIICEIVDHLRKNNCKLGTYEYNFDVYE